jgi:hypothetical protein
VSRRGRHRRSSPAELEVGNRPAPSQAPFSGTRSPFLASTLN